MSFRFLNNNASNNTDVVSKTLSSKALTPWVRNPSWPACEANSGDNRVRGLYAVWPSGANFIAMTVSAAYTVDYGDGTTTNYTSGSTAYYEYTYSDTDLVGTEAPVTFTDSGDLVTRTAHGYSDNMQVRFFNITSTTGISNGQFYYVINATANTFQVSATFGGTAVALTTDGTGQLLPYRIATVTITPQAANNLTSVNLFVKHNQSGLVSGYSTGWLDLAYAASTITTLILGNSSTTIKNDNIERVRLNQLGAITNFAPSFNGIFQNLLSLQNVEIASTITTVTDMRGMFSGCINLQTVPLFDTASVINMSNMFNGCRSLQAVPLLNTAVVTDLNSMFLNCSALQTVPLFNLASVTNMSSMFSGCSSLQAVPLFNTASVTSMNSTFLSCNSLQTVPLFNTPLLNSMTNTFQNCFSLQTVPLFNTASVTTMANMFDSCSSLQTVPLFNTAIVSNMSNMFTNCFSLETVPLFNTASVTNIGSTFRACSNLQTVPLFNTSSVTNFSGTFQNCVSLQTIPLFNTALVTTMSFLFSGCTNLQEVPALVTTAVTSGNFASMFPNCNSLARIQAKDFKFTFSVASCKLSATALDEIYTNLPIAVGQTITVTGNYGTATDNPAIATAKGWTVTG
jgi:surface protein